MNKFIYLPQVDGKLSYCCSTFLWKGRRQLAKLEEYLTEEGKHASLSLLELPQLFFWNKLEKPGGHSILRHHPQAPELGPG